MDKAENSKLNLKGKLSLKRSDKGSAQGNSNLDGKMNLDNGRLQVKDEFKSNSEDKEEDSLADFKSPKQEIVRKPSLNKYKVDAGKTKKKIAISRAKSRKSDVNQPSIEASLLKAQSCNQDQTDFKEAVPCPLCLKPFKDDTMCTSHMKNCAAKNNVSIKQLLEAKRLQDRQAQERKAIGLLAAPIIPEKKKTFRNKNFSTGDDPQLQLVLAMSESLYEAEKMVELEQAAFLAGIPPECITEMSEEERKKTLQNFGFTTNKPRTDIPTNKQRKKKLLVPTVLQTRSKEDKDRVLTERIACILTGDDALTQAPKNTENTSLKREPPTVITSRLLKKIINKDYKLWDQSRLTKKYHNFYVNELKSHFLKSNKQSDESEIHKLLAEDCEEQDARLTLNTSVVYEPLDLDIIINNQEVERDTGNCEVFNMNALEKNNFESEFVQNFINCWKEALNDSSASDLVIFVKNNKRIYAHKLVFHIQCPNILLDIEPLEAGINSPIGQKISWLDKEKDSALAFLEFVYSGTIHKYTSIFYHEELVHQVEELARLYKKQDLFTYIRKKREEVRFRRRRSEKLKNLNSCQEREITKQKFSVSKMINTQVTPKKTHHKLAAKSLVSNNLMAEQKLDRRITASPDLFDSEEDEANSSRIGSIENSENDAAIANSNNIKEENDRAQDSDESDLHMNSQKTLVNLSRSVSPVENIHEAITPPLGHSPKVHGCNLLGKNPSFNEQEIAEAVTPKCQSPEKTLDIVKQEVIESLASAVTPEHITDHITPKKLVYADMAPNEVTTHIDESIYTAVTPPRQEDAGQMIDKKVLKSELTMFIEKVQRRNAKNIMDTDSETDSPVNRVRPKNPFLKRDQDDSYKYLRRHKHHKAISLLEKDVLDEQKAQKYLENLEIHFNESTQKDSKPLKNDNPSTSKLEQVASANSLTYHSGNTIEQISLSDDEVQNITANETEMSMYTEYKKSNKCDNSITFYRKQLGFDRQKICTKAPSRSVAEENCELSGTSRSTVSQSATVKKPKPKIIADVTLVSDSDEGESPLMAFLRDKSKKKIYRSSSVTDMGNRDLKDIARPAFNIKNDVSLDPSKDSNVLSSAVLNQSKNKVIDLSVDSDDCDIHDETNNSSNKSKSFVMELQTSIDKLKELEKAEKKSEDIDAEISKILESSQELTNFDENLKSDQRKVDNKEEPSSISIASSPELCELANFNSHRSKNTKKINDNKCYNYSQNSESSIPMGENGDFDTLAFNDWNVKTPPKETARSIKSPEESSIRTSSSVRKWNCEDPPSNSAESSCLNALSNLNGNNNQLALVSSPILRQNRHSSEEVQEKSSRNSDTMKNKPERIRKLKVKSASTSSLTEKMGESDRLTGLLRPSSKFVTPEQNNKSSNDDHEDRTPPIDYSLLDTPYLQKQLRKFGLKPQSKARAKALLTHIYKETHSQPLASQKRNSNTCSSSEEDEPPAKRQYVRSVAEKNEHYSKENCSVLAEEMDLDEPDVASAFQNPVSIKDAFFKLIKTNKELYNKVLTYEPLALETLHSTLKQNGFKCQLNSLMNFLDEQCITFQVKDKDKGERIKK